MRTSLAIDARPAALDRKCEPEPAAASATNCDQEARLIMRAQFKTVSLIYIYGNCKVARADTHVIAHVQYSLACHSSAELERSTSRSAATGKHHGTSPGAMCTHMPVYAGDGSHFSARTVLAGWDIDTLENSGSSIKTTGDEAAIGAATSTGAEQ
jgi:hypothetical protein